MDEEIINQQPEQMDETTIDTGEYNDNTEYSGKQFDVFCSVLEDPVPMDILLDLCKKGKVDIKDIFISDITEQYLNFVSELQKKDYDNISNFLLLASTLLELKSNSLLPKVEIPDDDNFDLSPQDKFILFAEEYRMFKEESEKLRNLEILNRFYREPVFGEDDYKVILKNFDINKLINSFTSLMERLEFNEKQEEPKKIQKERFTVAERVIQVTEAIRAYKVINFFSLFEQDYTRVEIINTFLALLEILKKQIATAEQSGIGGDIIIKHAPLTDKPEKEELTSDVDGYN